MNWGHIAFVALFGAFALYTLWTVYIIARNGWVYRKRLDAIDDGTYDKLPPYEHMLYTKWWVWDVKKFLPITVALCLSSCVVMHERDGQDKHATYASLGGKGAYRKGYGVIHNHEKSFRDGAIAATTLAASYFGSVATQAAEATNQAGIKASTAKHASDNALKAKAIEANAAAHGAAIQAEVPGVVPAVAPPAITP